MSFSVSNCGPAGLNAWIRDIGRDETFERHVVGRLAGKIFGQSILVFENRTRITGYRRYHLGHDSAGCIARPQQHQFNGERGAARARHVSVDHSRKEVVRLLDELGRGPIDCGHDHGRELVDDDLDTGPCNVAAGQRRTDHRPHSARKIAYDIFLVARRCLRSACEQGAN
jgi:hypothetical protein